MSKGGLSQALNILQADRSQDASVKYLDLTLANIVVTEGAESNPFDRQYPYRLPQQASVEHFKSLHNTQPDAYPSEWLNIISDLDALRTAVRPILVVTTSFSDPDLRYFSLNFRSLKEQLAAILKRCQRQGSTRRLSDEAHFASCALAAGIVQQFRLHEDDGHGEHIFYCTKDQAANLLRGIDRQKSSNKRSKTAQKPKKFLDGNPWFSEARYRRGNKNPDVLVVLNLPFVEQQVRRLCSTSGVSTSGPQSTPPAAPLARAMPAAQAPPSIAAAPPLMMPAMGAGGLPPGMPVISSSPPVPAFPAWGPGLPPHMAVMPSPAPMPGFSGFPAVSPGALLPTSPPTGTHAMPAMPALPCTAATHTAPQEWSLGDAVSQAVDMLFPLGTGHINYLQRKLALTLLKLDKAMGSYPARCLNSRFVERELSDGCQELIAQNRMQRDAVPRLLGVSDQFIRENMHPAFRILPDVLRPLEDWMCILDTTCLLQTMSQAANAQAVQAAQAAQAAQAECMMQGEQQAVQGAHAELTPPWRQSAVDGNEVAGDEGRARKRMRVSRPAASAKAGGRTWEGMAQLHSPGNYSPAPWHNHPSTPLPSVASGPLFSSHAAGTSHLPTPTSHPPTFIMNQPNSLSQPANLASTSVDAIPTNPSPVVMSASSQQLASSTLREGVPPAAPELPPVLISDSASINAQYLTVSPSERCLDWADAEEVLTKRGQVVALHCMANRRGAPAALVLAVPVAPGGAHQMNCYFVELPRKGDVRGWERLGACLGNNNTIKLLCGAQQWLAWLKNKCGRLGGWLVDVLAFDDYMSANKVLDGTLPTAAEDKCLEGLLHKYIDQAGEPREGFSKLAGWSLRWPQDVNLSDMNSTGQAAAPATLLLWLFDMMQQHYRRTLPLGLLSRLSQPSAEGPNVAGTDTALQVSSRLRAFGQQCAVVGVSFTELFKLKFRITEEHKLDLYLAEGLAEVERQLVVRAGEVARSSGLGGVRDYQGWADRPVEPMVLERASHGAVGQGGVMRAELQQERVSNSGMGHENVSGTGAGMLAIVKQEAADEEGREAERRVRPQLDAGRSSDGDVMDSDVHFMLRLLPPGVAQSVPPELTRLDTPHKIVEFVVDHGRPLQVKFSSSGTKSVDAVVDMPLVLAHLDKALNPPDQPASGNVRPRSRGWSLIGKLEAKSPSNEPCLTAQEHVDISRQLFWRPDNRLTLEQSLHRISAIKDVQGRVTGLTLRIGRHIPGVATILEDVLHCLCHNFATQHLRAAQGDKFTMHAAGAQQSRHVAGDKVYGLTPERGFSMLLLGRPGCGKTTLLRDVTRVLSDECEQDVVVVDTSNEVAGDGMLPHPCIGKARRLMVPERHRQHAVMLEAVQNHMPQVVVIDELGRKEEVSAAREISQRGIMMVATAHGTDLRGLMRNNELNPLVGGLSTVTLGDMMANKQNRGIKTKMERSSVPAFDVLVELLGRRRYRVHPSTAASVDAILEGRPPPCHIRSYDESGHMTLEFESAEHAQQQLTHLALTQPHIPPHLLKQYMSTAQHCSMALNAMGAGMHAALQQQLQAGITGSFQAAAPMAVSTQGPVAGTRQQEYRPEGVMGVAPDHTAPLEVTTAAHADPAPALPSTTAAHADPAPALPSTTAAHADPVPASPSTTAAHADPVPAPPSTTAPPPARISARSAKVKTEPRRSSEEEQPQSTSCCIQ